MGAWLLDGITVAGEPYPIPADHPRTEPDIAASAMFEFTPGGFLNGWGPCNDFRTECELNGHALAFHDGYSTLLLCSDTRGLNEAEEVIFTVARSADVAVALSADATVTQLALLSTVLPLHRAPRS